MTSTSRFADATSTLQVGHACGQPYDPKWGDEPTALTLQVEHAWGKPNIRNICNPDWGDEPTASTLLAGHAWGQPNIRNPDWGDEPTAGIDPIAPPASKPPPEPRKPNVEDTGVGGKKHPIDLSGTDESDVPLKRQHVANPMNYDGVGKKHVYIMKNYTPDQKGKDILAWGRCTSFESSLVHSR